MKAVYFTSAAAFRAWLVEHHLTAPEIVVGFHKRATGAPSLTWNESVDAALCVGWIDGVRRGVDGARYTIRFTPRRKGSIWSAKNVARIRELIEAGEVVAAGHAAFEARRDDRTAVYAFERREAAELSPAQRAALDANPKAAAWFAAQAPYYQRLAIHWVISAKQEATRARRLATLISDSAAGRKIPSQRPTPKPAKAKAKAPKARAKPKLRKRR